MEPARDLVLVGLSQRTAPVAVRERYAVNAEDAGPLLRQLVSSDAISEAAILSTCNRTEALAVDAEGGDAIAALEGALFRNIEDEHLYRFRGVRAVMHLFRVASGLDSLVLGESEILGQVKRTAEISHAADALGPSLRPLLDQAIRVGKRARQETSIGDGSLSVARVGLDVAARALGQFKGRSATVLGAGETGRLVCRHLLASGVAKISLVNRTEGRAAQAATEFGDLVHPAPMSELGERLAEADIGVVCVDGAADFVGTGSLDRRALGMRDQPLVLLDLSVPRAIDPEVGGLDGVLLYDLDALLPIVDENRSGRVSASAEVGAILVSEVHKFLSLRTFATFSPAIEELRARFGEERERLIDRVTAGEATARELELAHAMEKSLLGLALGSMKESARYAQSEAALERAYREFLAEL